MHDATTVATPSTQTQAGRIGVGGTSGSASSAVKTQLKQKDFAAGEAMLTPRAPVQAKALQRSEAPADEPGECVDEPASSTSAQKDLGEVSSFAAALHTLGYALDALVPAVGSSIELAASASITASGVYGNVSFECSLTRTAFGLEGSITLSGTLGVGSQAATSETYAGFKLSKSLDVKGDDGAECADLAGLWAYNYLATAPDSMWEYVVNAQMSAARATGLSKLAADALWGAEFPAAVLARMDPMSDEDEGDTVSQSIGAGIAAGASDDSADVSAEGEIGVKQTTTLGKDDGGELAKETTESAGVTLSITVMGVSGSISVDSKDGWTMGLEIPVPKAARGMATAMVTTFANVIDDTVKRLSGKKAIDPIDADNMLGVLTNWHGPIVSGIEQGMSNTGSEIFSGSLGFEASGTFTRPPTLSLTVTNATTAELEGTAGAAAGGVSLDASASVKSVLVSLSK